MLHKLLIDGLHEVFIQLGGWA